MREGVGIPAMSSLEAWFSGSFRYTALVGNGGDFRRLRNETVPSRSTRFGTGSNDMSALIGERSGEPGAQHRVPFGDSETSSVSPGLP